MDHRNHENSIFRELSEFGLDEAANAPVFEAEAPEHGESHEKTEAANIERTIYSKTFRCPVCRRESKIPAIRSSFIRLIRSDTDFMPIYKDPNPLYYFVDFCKLCGYAATPANMKNLMDRQKKLIREKIGAIWKFEKQYPAYYDPKTAIEIHKLALYNAVVSGDRESVKAILSLHTGWLYRLAGDAANEKIFLHTACEGFIRAYKNESGSVGGLDKGSQQYLIGELMRRTGDLSGALDWFKLVLVDRSAKYQIKELARDQKDLITAGNIQNAAPNATANSVPNATASATSNATANSASNAKSNAAASATSNPAAGPVTGPAIKAYS